MKIHKKLFTGLYSHAGKMRDYNISKKEWVLDGASVVYGNATELRETLEYDFSEERKFSYKDLTMDAVVHHLAIFVSRLWQIHIFGEGNTRTTAVFFIKYLRTLGFDATNSVFAENAWYFRNALVRANYNDLKRGIHETTEYLELFLRNLLLDEQNELHNRSMHIRNVLNKCHKPDIQAKKPDIQAKKPDIEKMFLAGTLSGVTARHVSALFQACENRECFGRADVERITGLKSSRASELLKELVEKGILEPVRGYGKGKYRFHQSYKNQKKEKDGRDGKDYFDR